VAAVRQLSRSAEPRGADDAAALPAARTLVSCAFPPVARAIDGAGPPPAGADGHPTGVSTSDSPLAGGVRGATDAHLLTTAEQLLERHVAEGRSACGALLALACLVVTDHVDEVELWASAALAERSNSASGIWHAVAGGLRADIAVRQGDLAGAARHARAALAQLPAEGWGVAAGLPLSSAIVAMTATGRYEEAAGYLRQPVPDAMFRTPFGLLYLYARGRYYCATNRFQAAVTDLRRCGELSRDWALDRPAFVPWRLALAATHARLGDQDEASRLTDEHASMVDGGRTGQRGEALRLVAAAGERRQQPPGQRSSAVASRWTGVGGMAATEAMLSDAERRVARLAANGDSNREIARKLFITVSTVEQHLTRVYRKLNLNRRTDLAQGLPPEAAETA
jgi:DNA-binding CsgD family transcriptional regulator